MSKRVALYARLSVTTEESVSIERQLVAMRALAKARGWEVVIEEVDDGVSATRLRPDQRTGWRAILNSPERFDAVIVWKVDRLARRVMDFLQANEALRSRGAGIVSVEDPIDMTTAQGRAFATMLAVFAEMEAASISARVTHARRTLLTLGRRAGGPAPYGWMNVDNPEGPGKVLAQDPETVGYVIEAVERILAGQTLYQVTRWLDTCGAPRRARAGRSTDRWADSSVEAILRNPVVAGMTPYQPGRKPGEPADPLAVLRNPDATPVIDESVAIISTEERRRLISLLDDAKRPGSRPRTGKTPELLAGMVICANCQGRMHRGSVSSKYLVFRCQQTECSKRVTVIRSHLETYVVQQFLAKRGAYPDYTFERRRGDDDVQRADLEAARDDVLDMMKRDDVDMLQLVSQLNSLKARLASAESSQATNAVYDYTGQTVAERWAEEDDIEQRQKTLRSHIEGVRVASTGQRGKEFDPARVSIDWLPVPEGVVLPDGVVLTEPISASAPTGPVQVGGIILRTSKRGGTYASRAGSKKIG